VLEPVDSFDLLTLDDDELVEKDESVAGIGLQHLNVKLIALYVYDEFEEKNESHNVM